VKTTIEDHQFDCSRCGEVTFRVQVNHHEVDELRQPLSSSIDKVLNRGGCQAAAEGAVTHHGLSEHCPLYAKTGI
jgi:hypothetical protein